MFAFKEQIAEIEASGVLLFDLEPHHCRFPLSDREGFCGAERKNDSPYCRFHHSIAYVREDGRGFAAGAFGRFTVETVAPARAPLPKAAPAGPVMHDPAPLTVPAQRECAAKAREVRARIAAAALAISPEAKEVCRREAAEAEKLARSIELARQVAVVEWRSAARAILKMEQLRREESIYVASPSVREIVKRVSAASGATIMDILSHRRTADIVLPRQFAMYLARIKTLKSLPEIGRFIGGRDHTTVMHACRKIERLIASGNLPEELAALIPQADHA